jgi:hypothetical protein
MKGRVLWMDKYGIKYMACEVQLVLPFEETYYTVCDTCSRSFKMNIAERKKRLSAAKKRGRGLSEEKEFLFCSPLCKEKKRVRDYRLISAEVMKQIINFCPPYEERGKKEKREESDIQRTRTRLYLNALAVRLERCEELRRGM